MAIMFSMDIMIQRMLRCYSLEYRPPAPEVIISMGAQVFASAPLHLTHIHVRLTLEVEQSIGACHSKGNKYLLFSFCSANLRDLQ